MAGYSRDMFSIAGRLVVALTRACAQIDSVLKPNGFKDHPHPSLRRRDARRGNITRYGKS